MEDETMPLAAGRLVAENGTLVPNEAGGHVPEKDTLVPDKGVDDSCENIEMPLQCPFCDHKCVESQQLNNHVMARHTGERPYECPYCYYRCVESEQLNNHVMARHA